MIVARLQFIFEFILVLIYEVVTDWIEQPLE